MSLHDEKCWVSENMKRYGGQFIKNLGCALAYADYDNVVKIKATWPKYWQEYLKIREENQS
jgi:hypothetical protein